MSGFAVYSGDLVLSCMLFFTVSELLAVAVKGWHSKEGARVYFSIFYLYVCSEHDPSSLLLHDDGRSTCSGQVMVEGKVRLVVSSRRLKHAVDTQSQGGEPTLIVVPSLL